MGVPDPSGEAVNWGRSRTPSQSMQLQIAVATRQIKTIDERFHSFPNYVGLVCVDAVQGGRLRSGSVPPPSLLRAGSQPPGARSGSAAPQEHRTAAGHRTTISGSPQHRTVTTTSVVRGVRGDGTTGVVNVGPARRRASISVIPSGTAGTARRTTNNQQQPIVRI